MKSKLVFEGSPSTPSYEWSKYTVGLGMHYNWKQYEILQRYIYNWNKYNIATEGVTTYIWNKYAATTTPSYYTWQKNVVSPVYNYAWNQYEVIPMGNIRYAWNKYNPEYVWGKYTTQTVPTYTYQYSIDSVDHTLYTEDTGPSFDVAFDSTKYVKFATITSNTANMTYSNIANDIQLGLSDTCTINSTTGEKTFNSSPYHAIELDYDYNAYDANDAIIPISEKSSIMPINGWIHSRGGMGLYLDIGATLYRSKSPWFPIVYDKNLTPGASTIATWTTEYNKGTYCRYTTASAFHYTAFNNDDYYVYIMIKKTGDYTYDIYLSNTVYNTVTEQATQTGTATAKGSYISDVTSTARNAYPDNDYQGSNWYLYDRVQAGTFIETVYSTDQAAHSNDKLNNDGFYYANYAANPAYSDSKGSYIGQVTSASKSAYPENGVLNNKWYQYYGQSAKSQGYATAEFKKFAYIPSTTIYYTNSPLTTLDRTYGYITPDISTLTSITVTSSNYATLANTLFTQGNKYIFILPYLHDGTYYTDSYWTLTENSVFASDYYGASYASAHTISSAVGQISESLAYQGIMAYNSSYMQTATGETQVIKGDYIEQISDTTQTAYPTDGVRGDYWYTYDRATGDTSTGVGTLVGTVNALEPDAYPQNGTLNGYWYIYQNYTTGQYAGDYIKDVTAETRYSYPDAGVQDGYWYTYQNSGEDSYAATFIDNVTAATTGAYPTDGVQDGYWYKYIGETIADIYTLTDSELIDGVEYKQDINGDTDYMIGTAASAQITFVVDNTAKDASKYTGKTCRYYSMQGDNTTWTLIGKFIINDVAIKTKKTAKLTGYDSISKFDMYVDAWVDAQTFPMTLQAMFNSLCLYCGCSYQDASFVNSTFSVPDNFSSVNTTGRQVLKYIAQAAASFAMARPDGTIVLKNYVASGITLDNTKYCDKTVATYQIEPITKVLVQATADDVGVTAGTGSNIYRITNNPLFYTNTTSEIQQQVTNVYNVVNQVVYTPCKLTLLQDFGINCGDIVMVDGDTVYVMSKTIKSSGIQLECTGNKVREATGEETNSEIVALRGKYNELTRDIESTNSKIVDTKAQLETEITQKTDSISATVTSQGQEVASIKESLDGISLTYNSAAGTASITIGETTIQTLVDSAYVDKKVAAIDITGYVTFNSLSGSGTSTINGDNITTGTISADRLNLTGCIAWGDLTDNCKQNIINYAGEGDTIPSYIKSTYIDSTTIYSPTIYGAQIYAGSSADGYVSLASTGMNFCSKSGGALIGMGYYAGNYNYPYFILGSGVDAAGTDRGMIKKYSNGIWIGDSDNVSSSTPGGTGIFINFNGTFYKYKNGTATTF